MLVSGVQFGLEATDGQGMTDGFPTGEASAARGGPTGSSLDWRGRPLVPRSGRLRPTVASPTRTGLRGLWNWLRRSRPFPYPRQVAGTAMALFFVIGGLTTLLTLALPHPSSLHVPIMVTLGSIAPFAGLAVYLLRHRLPSSAYPWLLVSGTIIVTVLTAATGGYAEMTTFSFFYIWIVLYAVLFFTPLGVAVHVALVMVGYWVISALYDNSDTDKLTPFGPVILVSIIATTSVVFSILARAREASEIDPLTGVANRRGLDRTLDMALQFAERIDPLLNVAMIDVDHFKTINDENGHAAGDQVLENLTTAWRPLLRPGDSIGRRGGDEFLVVLPGCAVADAAAILERLRSATPAQVTCSIGAAHWCAGDSASMLVSKADVALYQAKRRGRNRVAWASTD